MLANLLADVHYGLRGFAKRPLFAAVIVLTLALGVGVNAALFSLVEQVLLRPLPVPAPERLVNLVAPGLKLDGIESCGPAGPCEAVFSYPMFRDLEEVQTSFVGIAAHREMRADVAVDGRATSGRGLLVSGSYFQVLGIAPAIGRLLGPQDDAVDGEAQSAVLSYPYWQSAFGGDPAVLGTTILLNGRALSVVGVAPQGFHGTTAGVRPDVYVPITFRWPGQTTFIPTHRDRNVYWAYLFARLRDGVSIEEAQAAINGPYRGILQETELPLAGGGPDWDTDRFRAKTVVLASGARGQSDLPSRASAPLGVMLTVTAIVLLIACANIANLLLARGTARAGEMAVRSSMGAARGRLASLLLVESLLLAAAAAVVSLPLTGAVLAGIGAVLPAEWGGTFEPGLSVPAVAAAGGIALASVLVFGLLPALRTAGADPATTLRAHGGHATGGPRAARFRTALATVQIALSMMLLVMAGLFTQSLVNVARVDIGIDARPVAAFGIAPQFAGYAPERATLLFDRLEETLAAAPGVTAVGSSTTPVMNGATWESSVSVEGGPALSRDERYADVNHVGGEFFRALGVPLVAGRNFDRNDSANAPKVAIVNQRFAERFGLVRPLGARLGLGSGPPQHDIEIVGVVRDAKYSGVKRAIAPQVFFPRLQSPEAIGGLEFHVRAAVAADGVFGSIRQTVAALDPNLPLSALRPLDDQVRENMFMDRFLATLALALALLATLLAALGLYGVLTYGVAQRAREIGLRLALGAPPERVRSMVQGDTRRMAIAGGAIGLGAAWLLGRAANALLFDLEATDPLPTLCASAVLAAAVLVAGYVPARRAARVDPMTALRAE